MVLANDNWWGYTSCLLFKYQVTWLEAAIVQPCWASMLVCYVEGDEGHLLGSQGQKRSPEFQPRGKKSGLVPGTLQVTLFLTSRTTSRQSDVVIPALL